MQHQSDAQLLREYAAQHSDPAFAEIVARHTDLVYSAALRQTGSPELAREIAQSVFTDLARKARALAGTLSADASLAGWLFRGTRFAGLKLLRDDQRRQTRERQFMEHFQPASQAATDSAPDWKLVAPVLDEGMAELDDADQEALLLRYFQNQDFHAVGRALGVSDDAAQKRVSRAVERLREFLAQRGVTTGASGLVVLISANAVLTAPAGLSAALATAALAGTTLLTAATATVGKALAMTTTQKTLFAVALAAAVGTGIYEAHQASILRTEVQTLRQQPTQPAGQIQQLINDRDESMRQLAALRADNERLIRNTADLLKLRAEVTRLRNEASLSPPEKAADASTDATAKSWLARVKQLKQYVDQNPSEKIPEFQFLSERDWLAVADAGLETASFEKEDDYGRALQSLRFSAENSMGRRVLAALQKYSQANNGQFPGDISQLQPYCDPSAEALLFQLYEMRPVNILPASVIEESRAKGDTVIMRKTRVNPNSTSRLVISAGGMAYWQSRL